MGKLAVGCTKQIERLQKESTVLPVLKAMRSLLLASPAPFRPTANTLRPILYGMLLDGPDFFRLPASDLLSVLHFTSGKAGAPAAWSTEMKDALGGVSASISALTAEAWEEEPLRAPVFPAPASFPAPPMDPLARASAAVAGVEGYIEACVALLTVPANRPVPVPLAQVVSVSLRLLALSLDSPMAPHISPAHRAALLSSLPRLWNAGVLLLASAVTVCGDHLLPHLEAILEHTVYLLEHIPTTMNESRLRLLHLHSLLLEQFSAAVLPLEYTQRLLKYALGIMGSVMAQKQPTTLSAVKKGKKRARGQEDALLGGLEGRAPKPVSQQVANVVLAALDLTPRLHKAPLLPASHLTLSLRLHVSMYLTLPSKTASFASPTSLPQLNAAVTRALEAATALSLSGTARDIRTLLLSLLPPTTTSDLLLHPALPPMSRPAPPLAQLQFIQESEEERKLRRELGFSNGQDEDEDEDDDMALDEPAVKRVSVRSITMQEVSPLEAVARSVSAEVLAVPTPASKTAPGAPVPFGGVAPFASSTPAAPASVAASAPFGSTPAPAPVSVTADAPTPVTGSATPQTESATPAAPFMSTPSSKPSSSSSALAPPPPAADVAMVVDDDDEDEAIPDLDSGSSDEENDDDDDE